MSRLATAPRARPPLRAVGRDLLTTTRRQRAAAFARPFAGLVAFAAAAALGWWWLAPPIVGLIIVAGVTVTHDVVHRALGLGRRQTEWALFVFGAVLLESGHAFRASHLQHHRRFPHHDDVEGAASRASWWGALLRGPLFLPRLWVWAFRRARPDQRRWMLAEVGWAFGVIVAGVLVWPLTPAVLVYALLVVAGSWLYPLLTVYLPHRHPGHDPLTQTGSLRGRLVPALLLEQTYHLEHHLYPAVPSHHLPELARRLDPYLAASGVRIPRAP